MRADGWRQLLWLSLATIGLAVALPLLAPADPLQITLSQRLLPPSSTHLLGTDELGRDVLSRLLVGTGSTVLGAALALAAATIVGIALGAVAGTYAKQWPDQLFNAIAATVTALPPLLIVVAVLGVAGSSLGGAYVVLACLLWVTPARLMRQQVMTVSELDYVAASRLAGKSPTRLMMQVVVPNCVHTPMVVSMSMLTEVIALEAGLSFLGLGVQPPQPSLGRMIFEGLAQLGSGWWLAVMPAGALAMLILTFSVLLHRPEPDTSSES
jgi:peptide/nickel transport system permease protein